MESVFVFLLRVVAAASEPSAAVTSVEAEAGLVSGADLNEALVGVLAAVSVLFVALLGALRPAAGLLSGFTGADLLGVDLVGVFFSLSFVVLGAGVCLAGAACVLVFAGI